MSLVFFCDRNLGKRFGQIRGLGLVVELHDEHFPPDHPDEALPLEIAGRGWILLTFDHRMHRNPVEKSTLLQTQSRVILLPPPKHGNWANELASAFHQAQGKVEAFFQRYPPPVVARFEINLKKVGKSRFILRRIL